MEWMPKAIAPKTHIVRKLCSKKGPWSLNIKNVLTKPKAKTTCTSSAWRLSESARKRLIMVLISISYWGLHHGQTGREKILWRIISRAFLRQVTSEVFKLQTSIWSISFSASFTKSWRTRYVLTGHATLEFIMNVIRNEKWVLPCWNHYKHGNKSDHYSL